MALAIICTVTEISAPVILVTQSSLQCQPSEFDKLVLLCCNIHVSEGFNKGGCVMFVEASGRTGFGCGPMQFQTIHIVPHPTTCGWPKTMA